MIESEVAERSAADMAAKAASEKRLLAPASRLSTVRE
ncbi:hypothetical protein GGE65_000550 [Skermanella aerolata]